MGMEADEEVVPKGDIARWVIRIENGCDCSKEHWRIS
jgi:hypothetical protein